MMVCIVFILQPNSPDCCADVNFP